MNRHTVSVDTYIYRFDANGEEVEIKVEISGAPVSYLPAKTSGPPENCYPAEGGYVEDIVATFRDGKMLRDIPLTEDEIDIFNEALAEAAIEDEQAAYEDAMEARAEARAEREWDLDWR